jgi:hypothetical protein
MLSLRDGIEHFCGMTSANIVFLGVKSRVLAFSKDTGIIVWSTELPSGMGIGFVTVLSDGAHVFAHTHGKLHCLDMGSGRVLWSNELPGCGYGIASLCLANGVTAPNLAAVQQIFAEQQSHTAALPAAT